MSSKRRGHHSSHRHIITPPSITSPSQLLLLGAALFCLASVTFVPILLLEQNPPAQVSYAANGVWSVVSGVHDLQQHFRFRQPPQNGEHDSIHHDHTNEDAGQAHDDHVPVVVHTTKKRLPEKPKDDENDDQDEQEQQGNESDDQDTQEKQDDENDDQDTRDEQDDESLPDAHSQKEDKISSEVSLARGVAGRPMSETPALEGARKPHIECDEDVDDLAYWNIPGPADTDFQSPFETPGRYITFAPDRGGWNNVRMSMEIIFVIAAATGRTLVLPPKEPLYLMHHDKVDRYRGFADFFQIDHKEFPVKVISMEDFLTTRTSANVPGTVLESADHCDHRKKSSKSCDPLFQYLKEIGTNPQFEASKTCLIFDEEKYSGRTPSRETLSRVRQWCGTKRETTWWNQDWAAEEILHFPANEKANRLLAHFYGMIHFTDSKIDNHFKRFVRDHLHYHDAIFCAAGKIIHALQNEGQKFASISSDGKNGSFSALHVRRGDLQYKKVKISAKEWYENTKEVWKKKELLYIATDERDKSFFEDIREQHELRFLDDFWDMAGLGELDPNYMGMIDTIVASHGRAFAGTWFSTFSGYINRLRGYKGLSMRNSWYGWIPRKDAMQTWTTPENFAYAFEWPDGWIGVSSFSLVFKLRTRVFSCAILTHGDYQ